MISGQWLKSAPRPEPQRSHVRSIDADVHSQRIFVSCDFEPRLHEHRTVTLMSQPGQ
jgi:hypothetical protein